MSSFIYDDTIKYWSEEAWKEYFVKDLGDLHKSCNEIIAINECFKREIDKQLLSKILNEEPLFKVLLGGLNACMHAPTVADYTPYLIAVVVIAVVIAVSLVVVRRKRAED